MILIIWSQDYRKEKGERIVEIVTDGKNDKTTKRRKKLHNTLHLSPSPSMISE